MSRRMLHPFKIVTAEGDTFAAALHPLIEAALPLGQCDVPNVSPDRSFDIFNVIKVDSSHFPFEEGEEKEVTRTEIWAVRRVCKEGDVQLLDGVLGDVTGMCGGVVHVQLQLPTTPPHNESTPVENVVVHPCQNSTEHSSCYGSNINKFTMQQSTSVKEGQVHHFGCGPWAPADLRAILISCQPRHVLPFVAMVKHVEIGLVTSHNPVQK